MKGAAAEKCWNRDEVFTPDHQCEDVESVVAKPLEVDKGIAIFAPSRHSSRAWSGPKAAILGVKIGPLWRAGSGVGISFGKCFMSHITPQCMAKHEQGPFLPPPGTHPGPGVVQKRLFWGSKSGPYGRLDPS